MRMSYSRRELYALGEPLGDSATYRKADGGLVLGDGGGGGGGGQPADTTQTQTSELPEWARGYAKDVLAKGQALTDINQNPYQSYSGDRIAPFSNLQRESFAEAGPGGFQRTVGAYMSPYQQNVTDIQKREAIRQAGIQGVQQQAQATQANAFGGGRDAIMRAERERNLMTQMNDIQAQGSQNAFGAATQQYNQGINQLSTLGGQQQAQYQKQLDVPYQEFVNRQNYPYKNLSYMSDLIRGTPLGMQSTNQLYQAPPSAAQQMASIGLGAYGLSKMAEGGEVQAYAGGGETNAMYDDQAMSADVSKLTDAQLQQVLQHPSTKAEFQAAQDEAAFRASMRKGLAGSVTNDMAERMAGGGIVAFAKGGLQDYMSTLDTLGQQDPTVSDEDRFKSVQAALPGLQGLYGASKTTPMAEEIAKEREDLKSGKNLDEAKGYGALRAASTVLKGRNLARGLGGAMEVFGEEVMKMKKENREADRALRQSQITLATADQARADGMVGKSFELQKLSEEQKGKALDRKIGIAEKQAQIAGGLEQAKIGAAASMASATKPTDLDKQADVLYKAAIAKDPSIAKDPVRNAQTMANARSTAADQLGRFSGSARVEAAADKAMAPEVQMALMKNRDYRAAEKAGNFAEMARIRNELVSSMKPAKAEGGNPQTPPAATKGPDLNTFLTAARKANPGVSDADLTAYYNSTYK